jgi:hypothetical protein
MKIFQWRSFFEAVNEFVPILSISVDRFVWNLVSSIAIYCYWVTECLVEISSVKAMPYLRAWIWLFPNFCTFPFDSEVHLSTKLSLLKKTGQWERCFFKGVIEFLPFFHICRTWVQFGTKYSHKAVSWNRGLESRTFSSAHIWNYICACALKLRTFWK